MYDLAAAAAFVPCYNKVEIVAVVALAIVVQRHSMTLEPYPAHTPRTTAV
jgi:hypothetical protein